MMIKKRQLRWPIVLLSLALWGCAENHAINKELFRVTSPDASLDAVVFERDVDATTDFSTQVTIVKHQSRFPNDAGVVFIADCNHGKATTTAGDGPWVSINWQTTNTLEISYDARARVFRKETKVGPIEIQYKETANQAMHQQPVAGK